MSFFKNALLSFNKGTIINQMAFSFREIPIARPLVHQKFLSNTSFTPQNVSEQVSKSNSEKRMHIFKDINHLLNSQKKHRLFAVVQLCGKQFKIIQGDIILIEGYWPPAIGDRICLDKVLLAGSNDFTLIGCPILNPGICDVQATIIEKTLTHTKTHFRKKRRKQYMRINFYRSPNTMLRINSIQMNELDVDNSKAYEGKYDTKIF